MKGNRSYAPRAQLRPEGIDDTGVATKMISPQIYSYLRMILDARITEYPTPQPPILPSGFQAEFLKCHLISAQVAVEFAWPPVVGIAFLEKVGKLYPWSHMVNAGPHGHLLDHSIQPIEPNLGFIRTGWDEWQQWRAVTAEYLPLMPGTGPTWGDPLADKLSQDYLPILRARIIPPPQPLPPV